jgi:D-3-phosphoglycerate dehydrogenase
MQSAIGDRPIILVTDVDWVGLDIEQRLLKDSGYDILLAPDSSEETLLALAPQASIILVCFARLTSAVINSAKRTTAIFRYGVGIDNIDLVAATNRGIPVYNVPDYCVDEVADHAILMMLSIYRKLPEQLETMASGGWAMPDSYPRRIRGLTLGLIGMGRIGQAVAWRAQGMGMKIIYTSSSRNMPEGLEAIHVEDLDDFLGRADCVSLHVPLDPNTAKLVDARFLASMKPSSVLINVSRGGLVDTAALLAALDSESLASAGLDGTDPEPLPSDHPLRSNPRCLVTPHFAYRSIEALTELRERIASGARAHAIGEDPTAFVSLANAS